MMKTIQTYIEGHAAIHFIGIGGVSMNSLAELVLSRGARVTGSDRTETDVTDRLQRLGARIFYVHEGANVEGADLVIRTSAIHDDNPEIIRARALGIPVMERAEAWGELMREYRNAVCLSGTHGKTTTTSMMTMVAMEAGMDPTVMVGSRLPAIGGTLRIGASNVFVAESCEYCNSFLSFYPTVAVILNVEADHLDFFQDIEDIIRSFHAFCQRTPEDGAVVVNADDKNAMRAAEGTGRTTLTFGQNTDAYAHAQDVENERGYYRFTAVVDGKPYARVALGVPGVHNMMNALAVCAASSFLGVPGDVVARGLAAFTGGERRFQRTGTLPCGAVVVDDYAHHPSEMRATLSAAREMGFARILCAFQPHTYTRTKALFPEFVDALGLCDKVVLAPVFAAREQNTVGVTSDDLAAQIPGARCFDTFPEIADYLRDNARDGDLVLTMGAGNINEVGRLLIPGNSGDSREGLDKTPNLE